MEEVRRIGKKKKALLLEKYGACIKPICASKLEWIRKDTSHYIIFDNHDNQHGRCEKCGQEVTFDRTIHNKEVRCPSCGKKMKVLHLWRRKVNWNMEWRIVPYAIDSNTLILRYVAVIHNDKLNVTIQELARHILDFKEDKMYPIELNINDEWCTKKYHFVEYNMYQYRRFCCLQGNACKKGFYTELKKLDVFKYFDNITKFQCKHMYVCSIIATLTSLAPLYEKLCKAGLTQLAINDWDIRCHGYSSYYTKDTIQFDAAQTSLMKMLGINKTSISTLRRFQTVKALYYLQTDPNADVDEIEMMISADVTLKDISTLKGIQISLKKVLKYCIDRGIAFTEYVHYIDCLKKLNYPLDKSYLYPKDFRHEDLRVSAEVTGQDYSKEDVLIAKISAGLRKMKNLKSFMDGSKGLLVYVPDSAWDLKNEGKALHNCIGSYINRVANRDTLVFFVRKVDSPNAPFVAFEYRSGQVVQCMYNYNQRVQDESILNFVNGFSDELRRNKVLVA